jgi:hypothetical protein
MFSSPKLGELWNIAQNVLYEVTQENRQCILSIRAENLVWEIHEKNRRADDSTSMFGS